METHYVSPTPFRQYGVLRLPMRDGNFDKEGKLALNATVLRLPMRDGNAYSPVSLGDVSRRVLRLPMRDGNP